MKAKHEDQDLALARKACQELIEHFDAVQIFCSRHDQGEDKGTVTVRFGRGNHSTRFGVVREWLIKEEERFRWMARKEEDDDAASEDDPAE